MRLLLDEHISPDVAYRLIALGFDVTCARDRGLLGYNDWSLFRWCIKHGYAVCSKNVDDFEAEHTRTLQRGDHQCADHWRLGYRGDLPGASRVSQ